MDGSGFSVMADVAGHTAARDTTEVPSFGWVGSEAPGSRVSIGVSAVIILQVLLCKSGKRVKPVQVGVQTLSSLKVTNRPLSLKSYTLGS